MQGDAQVHGDDCRGDAHSGPWHIGEVLEELLLQLLETDVEAARKPVAAT